LQGIPQEKIAKLAEQVKGMMSAEKARQDAIQSVVGRIVHLKPLVPDGKFHMDHLNSLLAVEEKGAEMATLTPGFKRQLHFWLTMLIACSDRCSILITAREVGTMDSAMLHRHGRGVP
jgi:hypothetical protein